MGSGSKPLHPQVMGTLLQLAESSTEARYVRSGTLGNIDYPLVPAFGLSGAARTRNHHMLSITSCKLHWVLRVLGYILPAHGNPEAHDMTQPHSVH
jgi:hypothetical protein